MNQNLSRIYPWVLGGFFFSAFCNFVFPLLTLLLTDLGFSRTIAAMGMSGAMLVAGLTLPLVGAALDRGKSTKVLSLCALGIVAGGVSLMLPHTKPWTSWVMFFGAVIYIVATASIYTTARRCTEGLAPREALSRAASLQYTVENAALGVAALLAFFFSERYLKLLLTADIVTTLIFVAVLLGVYNLLEARRFCERSTINGSYISAGLRFLAHDPWRFAALAFVLIGVFAHLAALPLLYHQLTDSPKSHTALMKITNTLLVVTISLTLIKTGFKLSPYNQIFLAAALIATGHMLAPFIISGPGIVLSSAIWSAGEAILYPAVTVAVVQSFPSDQPGLAVGVKDFLIRFGLFCSPLVAAALQGLPPYAHSLCYGGLPLIGAALLKARSLSNAAIR